MHVLLSLWKAGRTRAIAKLGAKELWPPGGISLAAVRLSAA